MLAYGVHDLQEAGVLPGITSLAWDISAQMPPSSWYASLLRGTINFTPETTWLQAFAWLAYIIPVMYLYLRPAPKKAPVAALSQVSASA